MGVGEREGEKEGEREGASERETGGRGRKGKRERARDRVIREGKEGDRGSQRQS